LFGHEVSDFTYEWLLLVKAGLLFFSGQSVWGVYSTEKLRQGFTEYIVVPTGRILLLSEMLCCVLVIQQLSFGKAETGICLCLPKAAPH
jgi:hypothetical protein